MRWAHSYSKSAYAHFSSKKAWHWMSMWMDGWMEGRAGLRIEYSNKKIWNRQIIYVIFKSVVRDESLVSIFFQMKYHIISTQQLYCTQLLWIRRSDPACVVSRNVTTLEIRIFDLFFSSHLWSLFYILYSFFLITHGIIHLNFTEYNSIFHIEDYEASFLSEHPRYWYCSGIRLL